MSAIPNLYQRPKGKEAVDRGYRSSSAYRASGTASPILSRTFLAPDYLRPSPIGPFCLWRVRRDTIIYLQTGLASLVDAGRSNGARSDASHTTPECFGVALRAYGKTWLPGDGDDEYLWSKDIEKRKKYRRTATPIVIAGACNRSGQTEWNCPDQRFGMLKLSSLLGSRR